MEDRPQQASGRQLLLPKRVPNRRIATSAKEAQRVPVTPGISFGTYDESPIDSRPRSPATDYFSSSGHSSSSKAASERSMLGTPEQLNGREKCDLPEAESKGSVISATFTMPQIIQLDKSGTWEISHRDHCSAHLDSLTCLSSEQSEWRHTVVAWTGEIEAVQDEASIAKSGQTTSTNTENGAVSIPNTEQVMSGDFCLSARDQQALEGLLLDDSIKTVPVWLGDDGDITKDGITLKNQSRWRFFAEHALCSLFHYNQQSLGHGWAAEDQWRDYVRMNELFAERISAIYKMNDIVIVNDYYLLLLPALLRKRCPEMRIIMTLEAPFPTSELVRCLRRRTEVLNGMLGADLICFQAYHYAQHFANSCARILGLDVGKKWVDRGDAHRTHLKVCPFGIDSSKVASLAFNDTVDEKYAQLAKLYAGKKVIIGCDSLDRLSGVDKKLEAFKYFLDKYPEWREKTVLIQFARAGPVAGDDEKNAKYNWRVQDLVTRINSAYGSVGSLPVQMHAEQLSQQDYFAIMRLGDVAVHTCIREGMSATGLEYITCQREKNGVLIISEFSGTACSLDEAIRVNPWDTADVAHQINRALTMTMEERTSLNRSLSKKLEDRHVEH